jgi:hypothetical protein
MPHHGPYLFLILFCTALRSMAQTEQLFRIYEDNDFINVAGKGTDRAIPTAPGSIFIITGKSLPGSSRTDGSRPRAPAPSIPSAIV